MGGNKVCIYQFGPFRIDAVNHLLFKEGQPVPLTRKAIDTLLVLIRHRGELVEKDDLIKTLWPDSFVEESNLTQYIYVLRKALGENAAGNTYIETIPKRGYRFTGEVEVLENSTTRAEDARLSSDQAGDPGEISTSRKTERVSADNNELFPQYASEVVGTVHTTTTSHAQLRTALARPKEELTRQRKSFIILLAALAIIVGIVAFLLLKSASRKHSADTLTLIFPKMRITGITALGKISQAAISPDGRYAAYVVNDLGQRSLWVKQIATSGNLQLVTPAEVQYLGLTFSADGNYIFYIIYTRNENLGVLYQVPVLGGPSSRLVADVDSPVTFSPDGRRMAFIRGVPSDQPSESETALMIANVDGTEESKLASHKLANGLLFGGPAWSPDGRTIACATSNSPNGPPTSIIEIQTKDGSERAITTHMWVEVGRIAWLPDGSGLVLTGMEEQGSELHQIWHVAYPGGDTRRITNDLNSYRGVSVTADLSALVTVQSDEQRNVWIASSDDLEGAKQIQSAVSGRFGLVLGLCWTPDGKIVYGSNASGNMDIWMMEPDGREQKQITADPHGDFAPEVSPDGRSIVFLSNRTVSQQVWRMDIDGSNQQQLTVGTNKDWPRWSPDGKWILYTSYESPFATIWRVPSEGGEPTRVTDQHSINPEISRDGKLISFYFWKSEKSRMGVAVTPFEGGPPIKIFDIYGGGRSAEWTPDGKALIYLNNENSISNIWRQPVNGGAPEPITNFKSGLISDLAWSRDHRRLVYARVERTLDAVIIRNFR